MRVDILISLLLLTGLCSVWVQHKPYTQFMSNRMHTIIFRRDLVLKKTLCFHTYNEQIFIYNNKTKPFEVFQPHSSHTINSCDYVNNNKIHMFTVLLVFFKL